MVPIPLSASLLLLALAPVFMAPASAQDPPHPPREIVAAPQAFVFRDLRSVLDTGLALQDRNGDGVVDFLDTRILFSSHPTEAEVAAASNLAARLGYETSAMDLGIAGAVDGQRRYAAPVILVGAGAVEGAGLAGHTDPLRGGLAPGQGLLAYLPAGGTLEAGGVAVVGYDATGLLEAASYFSGRYPEVWDPAGVAWREVAEKVESFVEGKAGEGASVVLDRVVVDAARPGVVRARVTVGVSAETSFGLLEEAFLGKDTVGSSPDSAGAPADSISPRGAPGVSTEVEEEPDSGALVVGDSLAGGTGAGEGAPTLSELEFTDLHRLDVRLMSPGATRVISLRPAKPWNTRADEEFRRAADGPLSLPGLYSVGGLYRDTNRDLVPDETAAYLSLSGSVAGASVVDLASRIGLETAGIHLPLARVAAQEDDPAEAGLPILLGTDHYQIRRLREEGKLPGTQVGPGEGFVQVVDQAFGDRTAMAVGGADAEGLGAATDWLARSVPYLWSHGKGEYRLADAETEIRRFLQARDAPGQVALALTKLDAWMERMAADPPDRVEVELAALEVPAGLEEVVAAVVRHRFPNVQADVSTWPTGFGVGDTVFVHDWEIPWEVEDARRILSEEVYGRVEPGRTAEVELRVSESPEIRASLESEIRAELIRRGASEPVVRVLSAYKQGYSWIHDVLLPQLRGREVASIRLTYHTLEESEEVRWQTIAADTRWLQEVYPFDAVLARELGIPDSVVTFRPTRESDPIYTFEAMDATGAVVLRDTFNPKYIVRPFFDLFPEYEQVRVTTGWISASTGGNTLVDRRIVTDPERFWDRLQTEAFGELIEYVMDTQDGDPSPDNAPYFDVFQVDLRLSEPNYRIGIDEEAISSLEALHEDVFFETHTLFNLLGGRYQASLSYPGRVLPFVDPSGEGRPGQVRVSLTGKARGNPELLVRTWRGDADEPLLQRYDLDPVPVEAPRLVGATLASGQEGVKRLVARVAVTDSVDRFREFEGRSTEADIDRRFISAEFIDGMLASLRELHAAGLFRERLSWDRVGEVALDLRMTEDSTFQRTAVLSRSDAPRSADNPRLTADGWSFQGEPLVQWETPISPEENEAVLARLATFPGVDVYYLTDSYLGHRVWAADFLPPQEGEYVSQAKLNALKPTLFISGREHANEVSSTSHILRLAELLVTDSAYMELLKKVNVVLHPMTNPDGAALAYERQLVNPHHMLHAGRPGALGVDATVGGQSDDPVYPEARARHLIREAWLPDVYLNPHGYPSHEWVQYFAGYSAWVRSRRGGARDWWVPRSWFIPGFSWVDDDENPDYKTAQFAILDTMAAAMTSAREVDAANRRLYARYRKYGVQDREGFTEYFHNGMLVNMSLTGSESIGNGLYSPRITYFSTTTEAPDETAQGDWMHLMGAAGLTHTSAVLRYLATGEFEVEREASAFRGIVTRKVFRVKPVLPGGGGAPGG
jgi:hypothetical protein